jgi:DNA mismatch repair protein MutS
VTFLYQVKAGSAAKSYGINVARLAKLPDSLLARAQEILHQLETKLISLLPAEYVVRPDTSIPEWQKELESIDPFAISPLEALHYLVQWKKQMKE